MVNVFCCYLVAQSCPTLCDPMDCSLPGSSVHGFPRQEYWSGLPFPSPSDLSDPWIEPESPAWQRSAARPQGRRRDPLAQTLPEAHGSMQKVKERAASTPFLLSTPPAGSVVYSSKPAPRDQGEADWLRTLDGGEEPHEMTNGKAWWAHQSRPEREDRGCD